MKNKLKQFSWLWVLPLLFMGYTTQAQEGGLEIPRHEVNFNIGNVLAVGSVELGYEYFLNYDQSVGVRLMINDRYNYKKERSGQSFHTTAFQIHYSYYFGQENPGSEFYVQPFARYRFGKFEERGYPDVKMDGFVIGIGGGYVWNISNSFVFGPFANIGRNFSSDVKRRFQALEYNLGVNVGYRF